VGRAVNNHFVMAPIQMAPIQMAPIQMVPRLIVNLLRWSSKLKNQNFSISAVAKPVRTSLSVTAHIRSY